MLGTLVGIQALCVGVSTYLAIRSSKRAERLKAVKKDRKTGFKHFRTGGF